MIALNLPSAGLKIKEQNAKSFVFDRLRKQYVYLTPEEWVRQHFIHFLIEEKNYPEGRLANEVYITMGNVSRRCDTVLYDLQLSPRMIIEYKAPSVTITQNVFDQILRYNICLKVRYLILSNGLKHFCCKIEDNSYNFLKEIPEYGKIE